MLELGERGQPQNGAANNLLDALALLRENLRINGKQAAAANNSK
jgi:hypothetical protein